MAAKLQCEICGGKLIGKPGGIFECENCGTEYSTEWAKAKIQEITGTVKVEGTVEVTGKVQVEGPIQVDSSASKEALLQRGNLALEDNEWEKAKELFDKVLDCDATCAEAYWGLAMAEEKCRDKEAFHKAFVDPDLKCKNNKHLVRARQFGNEALLSYFKALDAEAEAQLLVKRNAKLKTVERLRIQREKLNIASSMIAAGFYHTVGLKSNGTVVAVGMKDNGQCKVSSWSNIVALAAGNECTVGLKADGTVVSVGKNTDGNRKVCAWMDIVALSTESCTVGLKTDGTVVAEGRNDAGQCEVSGWRDIVAVAAGGHHTVGLKADGTVVATKYTGDYYFDFDGCNVSGWTDIVAIAAGEGHTVGLKADGTVVAVGVNYNGQCNVSGWTDIVAVAAGWNTTVGLKADGTVIAVGYNDDGQCNVSGWTDIVAVATGGWHTVGLKADGTVIAVGLDSFDRCDVKSLKLFDNFETIEAERKAAAEKAEAERKVAEERAEAEHKAATEKAETERKEKNKALSKEQATLQIELSNLHGLFTGKRRREIEARLSEIETELKKLK